MYEILKKEELSPHVYAMEIAAPRVAKKAEPGQFIILRVNEEDSFASRGISLEELGQYLSEIDKENDSL